MLSPLTKLALLGLVGCFMIAALAWISVTSGNPLKALMGGDAAVFPSTSDDAAIAFFQGYRSDFEKLRLLLAGSPIIFIHAERKEVSPQGALEDHPEKLSEILRLMNELRIVSANGPRSSWASGPTIMPRDL